MQEHGIRTFGYIQNHRYWLNILCNSQVWPHDDFVRTDRHSQLIVQYMYWAGHDVPLFELQLSW